MINILIADDESKVCWLIEQMIAWDTLHAACIGTANDGVTAYEMIVQKAPDIVITDIRMPDMDGLELVKRVKRVLPECTFVIISGYPQFEYAKTAIKYGVEDFLLKPINRIELNDTLARAVAKKEQHHQLYSLYLNEQRHVPGKPRMSRAVLENLLSDTQISAETLRAVKQIEIEQGSWMCVGVRVNIVSAVISQDDESFIHSRIIDAVKKHFTEAGIAFDYFYDKGFLLFLLCGSGAETYTRIGWHTLYESIASYLGGIGDCDIWLSRSGPFQAIEELPRRARQARELLWLRFCDRAEKIYDDSWLSAADRDWTPVLPPDLNGFEKALRTLDDAEVHAALSVLQQRFLQAKADAAYHGIVKGVEAVAAAFGRFLTEASVWEADERDDLTAKLALSLRNCGSLQALCETLTDHITAALHTCRTRKAAMGSRPVDQAKKYIQEHIMESCSLQCVAEYVRLSPSYLSSVFKSETGMNLKDYITEVKIQTACKLLTNTDQNIGEIANALCYQNAKYFSKVFEKAIGLKPSQYRKLMG